MRSSLRICVLAIGLLTFVALVGVAFAGFGDYGLEQQNQLQNKSQPLFGRRSAAHRVLDC